MYWQCHFLPPQPMVILQPYQTAEVRYWFNFCSDFFLNNDDDDYNIITTKWFYLTLLLLLCFVFFIPVNEPDLKKRLTKTTH